MKGKRSTFDLTHEHKTTCKMGQLIPIMCQEVMPGDTFKQRTEALCRITPLLAPLMHNVRLKMEFWFVPARLLWDNFETFITRGESGNEEPVYPYITAPTGGFAVGSLADHFGLPTGVENIKVNAMPFRAYNLIYNENYMDQNLGTPLAISYGDGSDTATSTALQNRCWEKDYFTSALPWAQRGNPVYLPLGTEAPVVTTDKQTLLNMLYNGETGSAGVTTGGLGYGNNLVTATASGNELQVGADSGYKADLTSASSITVDDMRASVQMQLWKNISARCGARYIEQILGQFGVRSSDARLQRPEFLGGGSTYIAISEVLQTSESGTTSPQGNMSGHGISYNSVPRYKRFFEEFGYVIGLLSVMPRTAYQQGIPKMWSRFSVWDYPFPIFDHLGEQKILGKEIYATGQDEQDDATWGFQGRFNELRYPTNVVSGQFRSTLSYWHMGRIFDQKPGLNNAFVTSDPTMRISAVQDEDNCLLDVVHHLKVRRRLSKHSKPGYMDHYF